MTSILTNSRRPDITVNASGRIDITSRIVKQLDLHPGDVIDVCLHGVEYLLHVRRKSEQLVGRHEGRCLPTSRGGHGSYRTWSVRLAKALREACGKDDSIIRFPCGDTQVIDDKIYVPIIVRNPL